MIDLAIVLVLTFGVAVLVVVGFAGLLALGRYFFEPPPITAPATGPTSQVLTLDRTQLVGWEVVDGNLVLDFFGGTGEWRRTGSTSELGRVSDTPVFSVCASVGDELDLILLERLASWCRMGDPLRLRLEAEGDVPLEHPRRLELADGTRTLSVLVPA